MKNRVKIVVRNQWFVSEDLFINGTSNDGEAEELERERERDRGGGEGRSKVWRDNQREREREMGGREADGGRTQVGDNINLYNATKIWLPLEANNKTHYALVPVLSRLAAMAGSALWTRLLGLGFSVFTQPIIQTLEDWA